MDKYTVIKRADHEDMYDLMDDLIARHHKHLEEVAVGLAFYSGWNPDSDGQLKLGKCRIVSELDRKLHGCGVIIVLNQDAWEAFSEKQRAALLDHELCHAELKLNKDLETVRDDDGRPVCRLRKHDIEEFREVVERHGIWTSGLRDFAESVLRAQKRLPFAEEKPRVELPATPPN